MRKRSFLVRSFCIAVWFGFTACLAPNATTPDWTLFNNWSLRETGDGFVLVHAEGVVPTFQIHVDGGAPKLLFGEVARADPRITLLHYYSGSAGTSQFYSFTRTIVIDRTQRKILGIVLKALMPEGNEPKLRQPTWTWAKGQLTVTDREYGGETILRW